MMGKEESLVMSLPPGVRGRPMGELNLHLTHFTQVQDRKTELVHPTRVRILWWGQSVPDVIELPSVNRATLVKYTVMTSEKRFRAYLRDAGKLVMEIWLENQKLGFAMVDQLDRAMDEENLIQKLDIFDGNGEEVGFIYFRLVYEPQSGEKKNFVPGKPTFKVPTKLKKFNPSPKKNKAKTMPPSPERETWVSPSHEDTDCAQSTEQDPDVDTKDKLLLPTWNISTSRLRFLSSVNQFCIELKSFTLTSEVLSLLIPNIQKSKVTLRSRGKAAPKVSSSSTLHKYGGTEPVSFFISFCVPPSNMSNNFCSRKLQDGRITFYEAFTQQVQFKPDTLDIWWTNDLNFKVLSRTMKQRESTLIGEATIGLKYLLIDSSNSTGKALKLPIYVSQAFFSDHSKLSSEIVGDLEVSFSFLTSPLQEIKGRPVSPQNVVRDNQKDFGNVDKIMPYPKSASKMPRNVTLKEPKMMTQFQTERLSKVTHKAFCLLKILEGRHFTREMMKPNNFYVSCRILTLGNEVQSQISWNSTRPNFSLVHYISIDIDEDFRLRCKNNFLVVEVWNVVDEDKEIVGVSMIPLHQFYLSFKDEERTIHSMSMMSPIIALDDWVPVNDLEGGDEVGQIKVLLAVGSEKQLLSLHPSMQLPQETRALEVNEEQSDEHIYDSVHSTEGDEDKIGGESSQQDQCVQTEDISTRISPHLNPNPKKESFACSYENKQPRRLKLAILEGRNFPKVFKSTLESRKHLPSTFVSYFYDQTSIVTTQTILNCANPVWNFNGSVNLDNFLKNSRSYLIFKIWNHQDSNSSQASLDNDQVIGFVAVDLSPLLYGLPKLCGWYNVMDYVGRCRGQIKVSIEAESEFQLSKQMGLRNLNLFSLPGRSMTPESAEKMTGSLSSRESVPCLVNAPSPINTPSVVNMPSLIDTPSPINTPSLIDTPSASIFNVSDDKSNKVLWNPPVIEDEIGDTKSFLVEKFRELDVIMNNLKTKNVAPDKQA